MENNSRTSMENLSHYLDEKDRALKAMKGVICLDCGTNQVQYMGHKDGVVMMKCRHCKLSFSKVYSMGV